MTTEALLDGHDRLRKFGHLIIANPRLGEIRSKIRWMLGDTATVVEDNEARRTAAKHRAVKLEELWILPIIGPSGYMKSTSIRKVVDEINADWSFPADEILVVVVSMREVKNTRAFLGVILEAYGDAAKEVIPEAGPVDAQFVRARSTTWRDRGAR
jgi:hypothetical protein